MKNALAPTKTQSAFQDQKPQINYTKSVCFSRAHKPVNDLDTPTAERPDKAFQNLRAQFALQGQNLQRTESKDGAVTYFATRWGLVRYLPTLEAAQRFYAQIGGKHEL